MSNDRARDYSRTHIIVSIVGLVLNLVILTGLLVSGVTFLLRDMALVTFTHVWLVVGMYFTCYFVLQFVMGFPLDLYGSFVLEHQYHLSNQTFAGWMTELAKRTILSYAFGLLIVEILYALIRVSPVYWWFWCWCAFTAGSLLLNHVVPIVIVPLFYKYTPVTDEALIVRIRAMVAGTKLAIKNVFSLNLSTTTKKANAAFMGLGHTKRVVLADTLLSHFSHDEIETVVAHEVGHFVRAHIAKQMVLAAVLYLSAFYGAFRVIGAMKDTLALSSAADVAGFPLVCLVFSLFGIVVMPLQNAVSRAMEREADRYALERTRNTPAFIATMNKLGALNLADPAPAAFIEWMFYSHPSLAKRIAWAERWQHEQ